MDKQACIKKAVFNIVSNTSGIEVNRINFDDLFYDDLGMDSVDVIQVQLEVEDIFCLDTPTDIDIETVGDLIAGVNKYIDYNNRAIFESIEKNKRYISLDSKNHPLITPGTIVEVKKGDCNGLRLFVSHHTEDDNGNILYSLTMDKYLVGKYISEDTISDPVEKMMKTLENMRIFHNFKYADISAI